jgi:hypothetical protein
MSARIASRNPETGWQDGITPEVQRLVDRAARALRIARGLLEEALQVVEPDSDADLRVNEALAELEGPIYSLEWAPPPDA